MCVGLVEDTSTLTGTWIWKERALLLRADSDWVLSASFRKITNSPIELQTRVIVDIDISFTKFLFPPTFSNRNLLSVAGWSGEYSGHHSLSQIPSQLHLVMKLSSCESFLCHPTTYESSLHFIELYFLTRIRAVSCACVITDQLF